MNIEIEVNGKRVPLNPFVKKFIINTIKGIISSLRGVKDIKTISIKIF